MPGIIGKSIAFFIWVKGYLYLVFISRRTSMRQRAFFSGLQGMVSQLSSHFHVNSRVVGDLETHGSLTTSLDQGGAKDRFFRWFTCEILWFLVHRTSHGMKLNQLKRWLEVTKLTGPWISDWDSEGDSPTAFPRIFEVYIEELILQLIRILPNHFFDIGNKRSTWWKGVRLPSGKLT